MKRLMCFAMLWVGLDGAVWADIPEHWTIRGDAVRLDTQEPFFTEYHVQLDHPTGQEHWLIYYISPNGELKAQKELIYNRDMPFIPNLVWQDFALQLTISGMSKGFEVIQNTDDPNRSEERTATIARPEQTAFDAGFDQLLRKQFAALQQQSRLQFDFLSLNTSQTFRFRAVVLAQDDVVLQVRVEPVTAFIRLFVDPILLTYDLVNQRLITYEGVTNFRREGDLVAVRIEYKTRGEHP